MTTLLEIFAEELENEPNIIELNFKKMETQEYLEHCLAVMKADKNLSDETKIIMFVEYAKKYYEDMKPKSVKVICNRCGTVTTRNM
jgi:hypothetical protein